MTDFEQLKSMLERAKIEHQEFIKDCQDDCDTFACSKEPHRYIGISASLGGYIGIGVHIAFTMGGTLKHIEAYE